MEHLILHIDMDAFYASIEQLDNPKLKGKPVIVGGTSDRGVVSTASYEARKFGIHSAMPIYLAKKKCPQAIFVPVSMDRYQAVSERVMEILEKFSPLIEQISIDEAYLDISGLEKVFGSPAEVALKIKIQIKQELALTCSIGIAPNKFLSKIASDIKKPDGLFIIEPEDVLPFIQKLPIKKISGVGDKTLKALEDIGIHYLGDVPTIPMHILKKAVGQFSRRLLELSHGIDDSPVITHAEPKSISNEDTLEQDTNNKEILKDQLLMQSEIVGQRLRQDGFKGKTITLKLKTSSFKLITRQVTLDKAMDSAQVIYDQGWQLLEKAPKSGKFRLIGISVSNLVKAENLSRQINLFEALPEREKSWQNVEKAMDLIQSKFGKEAIGRGRLLRKKAR
jgi:DNA polymerase-4